MAWLTGWGRRKKQTITGSTVGAQTNYQKKMTVHKGSGEDSATDVYCGGNCRDDFGDIRWTETDGTTPMDYWIEKIVSGDYAVFWVEFPSIPASPSTVDIYMYYDKSDATSQSNGDNTFILFDHFDDDSIDTGKWENIVGSVVESGTEITFTVSGGTRSHFSNKVQIGYNRAIRSRVKYDISGNLGGGATGFAGAWEPQDQNNSITLFPVYASTTAYAIRNRKTQSQINTESGSCSILTSYSVIEVQRLGTAKTRLTQNDGSGVDNTQYVPTLDKRIWHGACCANDNKTIIDWTLIRKIIDPEPAWGSWGSEETGAETKYATINSNARIKVPTTATINGNARVKVPKTTTVNGNARIKKEFTQTITGNARIKKPFAQTITGNARIQTTPSATIDGTARVKVPASQTISGNARIKALISKTITGNARISGLVGWLDGWSRRKKQTITGTSAGAQTNYQMKMTVHKGSGSDSATDVYCGGNCRDDFGDIRWTKADGTTLMDYWIEKVVSGDYAVFWVEIPSVPASPGTVDIYMYYDKSDATSVSDGDATFPLFDDFLGDTINGDKWASYTAGTGSISVSGGIVTLSTGGSDDSYARLTSILNWSRPRAVRTKFNFVTDSEGSYVGLNNTQYASMPNAGRSDTYKTELEYKTWTHPGYDVWKTNETIWTSDWAKFYQEDALKSTHTTQIPDATLPIKIYIHYYANKVMKSDWLLVREYASPEPTWGTWGDEAGIFYATISSNARIKITQPNTITGNARVVFRRYETIEANARVKKSFAQTINGTARIKKPFAQTITGNATVVFRKSETIGANARIKVPTPKTIQGNALIKAKISKTITGNAAVLFRLYETITGNACIESIQWYDTQLSYRFDREYKVRAIAGVANSIGYEWWVNEDGILCFFNQRGHDKSATITLSDDIIEVDQSFDATKIIDKLTVVGMGPGSTHLEITVGTGDMEGTFTAKNIHDIDTLTSFANAALDQTKEAKHRMIIKLVGTERTDIELGDIVHVTHIDSGIDGDYRIISMERVSGVAGDLTKLEIAVPQFRVTETLMNLNRRVDAEDYHPQGAPSILTLARADNVDSTHPLKMKFYIPPEAVDMGKLQIKEAKVALTLEAFRAYSTGAASGGGQTTSAGGGMTTSSGGGQTSSGGSEHSHSISGQTATDSGAHNHKITGSRGDMSDDTLKGYFRMFTSDGISLGPMIPLHYEPLTDGYTDNIGTHTHSVSGTTASAEATHTHTVSDHTHAVYDHTHSVIDHTHNISYGIYESTPPTNVYIKLNTTQIAGPFNADGYIDITTEFLNQITTYGWNTLEFTSSQLGKIGATLFMRLFLQAS